MKKEANLPWLAEKIDQMRRDGHSEDQVDALIKTAEKQWNLDVPAFRFVMRLRRMNEKGRRADFLRNVAKIYEILLDEQKDLFGDEPQIPQVIDYTLPDDFDLKYVLDWSNHPLGYEELKERDELGLVNN